MVDSLQNRDSELLKLLLEEEGIDRQTDESIIRRRGLKEAPASFQQRRLWFLHELEPTSSAYNISSMFRIDGALQVEVLRSAFRQLQQRHEILRTTFWENDGEPHQRIHPNLLADLIVEDWSHIPKTEIEKQISSSVNSEAKYCFDLKNGPLIRMALYRLSPNRHLLALNLHHIIADGWSIGIIIEELATLYQLALQGKENGLEELKIQYADYALYQREKYTDSVLEEQLSYWEKQLAQLPILQFPTDFTRPRLQTFQGDLVHFSISPALTSTVRNFSKQQDVTPFVTLMAAFQALLSRYSGQDDIPVGTSIANRSGVDTNSLIGFFVNMLVIRTDLSGEPSFRNLLSRVKETVLQSFDRSEVPFELLVERLRIERDTSRNPLFQIAFTLLNAPQPQLQTDNFELKTLANQEAARFDLELFVTEGEDNFDAVLSYNIDLFARETVERFAQHFCQLLENLVDRPDTPVSQLSFLLPEEYEGLVSRKPRQTFPVEYCLQEVFSQQADLRPNRTALIFEEQSLSYGELDDRANRLARHLIHLGVKPESRVGLWVSRSLEMVVAILAILKAGGTYVPLDPNYPAARVAYMLEDSSVAVLVTESQFEGQIPPHRATLVSIDKCGEELAKQKSAAPEVTVCPDNAAYIIYTSGSTGKPKGVVVTHRNVVRLMLATEKWFHFNENDVWTLFHSYAFDFSVWEIWGALFFGGCSIVVPYLTSRSPEDFYNLLCDRQVTVLNQTPSAFRQLMQAEEEICRESELNLRYVIFGGEALDLSSLESWFDRHGDDFPLLVNMYGITETTVHVTYRPIRLRDVKKNLGSFIGEPIPDLTLYLLDSYQQPVPIGVVGEIYVGGAGVTRGYLNREQLTAERMVPNPFSSDSDLLYKTGDLARYRHNGDIEYLGRKDNQVKIRGFRVELGEIEAVLQQHPGVFTARVVTRGETKEYIRLIAYIVSQTDTTKIPDSEAAIDEQIQEWQYTFNETYRGSETLAEEDFNIAGWNSSYDTQPIPAVEMRQWLKNTLVRIAELKPEKVLEIGCGTGMILLGIAPKVESYWATDFSSAAIELLEKIAAKRELSGVRLQQQEAIDFTNIPESYFDTIVINSVAQYFPSIEYFQQVIEGALNALAPGGSLFIGDNRDLQNLSAIQASIAFFQADDTCDRRAFGELLERIAEKENELVIDPAFFCHLPKVFEILESVEIHLKEETAHNELTKYRYDVILHKQGGDRDEGSSEPIWENWQDANLKLTDLRDLLQRAENLPLGWLGIPNARLVRDREILRWYRDEDGSQTVGEFREILAQQNLETTVDPSDLYEIARQTGCQVSICYSDFDSGCFDACFYPAVEPQEKRHSPAMPLIKNRTDLESDKLYWVNPLKQRFAKKLISQLKQEVREQLPEYMQPASYILLESFPMTPSGKLDLRALPVPERETAIAKGALIEPNTSTQERLCRLWQDVLNLENISIDSDFFQLGGHSLLATKLVSRIREEFDLAFPLRKIFECPTVESLAEQIDLLSLQSNNTIPKDELIPRVTQRENLPLSFAQQRLWFLDRLEPNNPAYNIMSGFRLQGNLDREALHHSLQEIVKRHEVLRTTFSQDELGNPIQVINSESEILLNFVDLTSERSEDKEEILQRAAMAEAIRPFNLEKGPLIRIHLYRLEEKAHVFIAVMHHIVSDGWSFGIIVEELSRCYTAFSRGKASPLSPLSLQYADFAYWQRTTFEKTQLQEQLNYWKEELGGEIDSLELPTDFLRPAIANYEGRTVSFAIEREKCDRFKQLCESLGATPFMGLLGVFKTLLMRYSGQQDILVGTPIANRNRKQTEDLIGFFVNTLVIRTDLGGNPSFTTLLERIKDKTLQAYARQDLPFERLVEELQPDRNLSHNPLFQVMFVLQNAPMGNLELRDLSLTSLELESVTAKFDLTLSITETETGLEGKWEYKTDLFAAATIERMAGHFQILLEEILAQSDRPVTELPLLTRNERQQLENWNDTKLSYPQDLCIHNLFELQVEKTPDAIAVVFEDRHLTYRELNRQANQLAHYLQSIGVKPEMLVGICVERSIDAIVGILGILKAGAAYLPLDPAYPEERLAFMLSDARTPVLLTQQLLLDSLPENDARIICLDTQSAVIDRFGDRNAICGATSENLAYVIYTSGSTGQPKGVQIAQKNLVHLIKARIAYYREPVTSFLLLSSLAFDASIPGIFGTLCQGGMLYLPREDKEWELSQLIETIAEGRISHLISLPSLYALILERGRSEQLASLSCVVLAAESCSQAIVSEHFKKLPETQLFNEYGPTEGTVWSSVYNFEDSEKLPISIGRPIANTQLHILDRALQPVPIGVPGELYLSGFGLSRGYLNRPDLTAERFLPNPWSKEPGARLYKTGDKARYFPDGNIELLGRIDRQVKIRGFRIELGEIETVLCKHPKVRQAIVLFREEQSDRKNLVAYIVADGDRFGSTSKLRRFLQEKLPDYAIPGSFEILESLPLMPNGKVNIKALTASNSEVKVRSGKQIPPRTSLEQQLLKLWEEVLQLSPIGVTENFFEIGGHSLLAIRLLSEIEKHLGYNLPLVTFFREGTIEKIAVMLEKNSQGNEQQNLIPLQTKGDRPPLFLVHQHGGYGLSYSVLARTLGKEQPVYALQASGLDGRQKPKESIEAMASNYLQEIREILPQGPYFLGGHSFGGLVAFEMASQLEAAGENAEHVLIVDTHPPLDNSELEAYLDDDAGILTFCVEQIGLYFNQNISVSYEELSSLDREAQLEKVLELLRSYQLIPPDNSKNFVTGFIDVYKANSRSILSYQPKLIKSPLSVFKTHSLSEKFPNDPTAGWGELVGGKVGVYSLLGDHQSILQEPHVQNLAQFIQFIIAKP